MSAAALQDDGLRAVRDARRVVVKVGSSLVTNEGRGLDAEAISLWGRQIAALRAGGKQVVMVSSGAIAEGMKRLGWPKRPHEIHEQQAAAAVGQALAEIVGAGLVADARGAAAQLALGVAQFFTQVGH